MTYRFKLQEPIGEGVRRIGLEQIEIAEAKLSGNGDVSAAIHDARRCLKRMRALLRLVRPALQEELFHREATTLSGTGKLLSGARDLDVTRLTLKKLESYSNHMPPDLIDRLEKLVGHSQDSTRLEAANGHRRALLSLRQSKKFFAAKATSRIQIDEVINGLGQCYRKARKASREAYLQPSDESFHTWRKWVQLHWRHMALLSRGWPEELSARASEAKELSRLLGEDHDYSVLLAFAREHGASVLEPKDLGVITAFCRSRQAELRAAAKPRGDRLFAEPVANLEERVEVYWTSAQNLAALAAVDGSIAHSRAPVKRVKSARLRKRQ